MKTITVNDSLFEVLQHRAMKNQISLEKEIELLISRNEETPILNKLSGILKNGPDVDLKEVKGNRMRERYGHLS